MLRKEGYKVGFKDFIKIGLPFTFAAVIVAYIFLWYEEVDNELREKTWREEKDLQARKEI